SQASPRFQPGGESKARRYFASFLEERAENYTRYLSKPHLSRVGCSRLSPYIAYGNLSVREIYQRSQRHRDLKPFGTEFDRFRDRLWWRSHYIQKLESEPQLEFEPLNPGFKALSRPRDERMIRAFAEGKTGFPMIDASIRCLQANGYLNFRMRAMLATFGTFVLRQPFRPIAESLARLFLDYEPGIHFSQIQMQAGLTGYHPLRIFSPIQQGPKHDPEGVFVKTYLPELAEVPTPLIFTPWDMSEMEQQFYCCQLGRDYPAPILDYDLAVKASKSTYWTLRQSQAVQSALPALWRRHCLPENIREYLQNYRA
ncbi:MAG: FAD-binding domain-containing protein, partial [Bacteroidota bacterium]